MILTIITPTFNSEKTILACIESINAIKENQFEHLIIDGVSTDKTLEIIEKFKKENPNHKLKVISEQDKGIYDAMNKGIIKANGKWLYFLGSDDVFLATDIFLDLENQPENVVFFYGNVFYQSKVEKILHGREFFIEDFGLHNICHQAIFYRKEIFNELGLFDISFKTYADYLMNFLIFTKYKINQIIYKNKEIAIYSLDGFSSNITRNSINEIIRAKKHLIKYFKKVKNIPIVCNLSIFILTYTMREKAMEKINQNNPLGYLYLIIFKIRKTRLEYVIKFNQKTNNPQ